MNNYWILQTGPENYRRARIDDPEAVAWTVSSQSRRGDLFLLYGHSPLKEYGLIGRVCSHPVRGPEGDWWAHVEMICLPDPMSLRSAKADPVIGRWPRLKMMIGSSLRVPDEEVWGRFMALLVDPHPRLRQKVDAWQSGAPFPKGREPLADAVRDLPNSYRSGTAHEHVLQDAIRDAYTEEGWARELRPRDRVDLPESFHLGSEGYPDLVLVDRESGRTLLLIEVKRDAVPGRTTDGVTQLLRYEPVLREFAPNWEVKKVLIALAFSAEVVNRARTLEIECWRYDETTQDLYDPFVEADSHAA